MKTIKNRCAGVQKTVASFLESRSLISFFFCFDSKPPTELERQVATFPSELNDNSASAARVLSVPPVFL